MRLRTLVPVAVVIAVAGGMAAAEVAGSGMAASGPCRIAVRGARVPARDQTMNWRLLFAGGSGDREGRGTLRMMNGPGDRVLGESPFTWRTAGRRGFRADLAGEEFGGLVEALHLRALDDGAALVRLEGAGGRGAVDREGNLRRFTVKVRGALSLRDGGTHRFRMKVRMR